MAIIFQLWVEGMAEDSTNKLADHFEGVTHVLKSGKAVSWTVRKVPIYDGTTGLAVSSAELSQHGVHTLQESLDLSEAGIHLYHHLLCAPPFRFARVALEAENIPAVELDEYFSHDFEDKRGCTFSCVLHKSLQEELGELSRFTQFRQDYVWNGYRGEEYRPLWSGDHPELRELYLDLLPR